MGNQHTMCCADTTGCQKVELSTTSSFEHSSRGKPRLLRRVIDTFRPSPKREQQKSVSFKGKFASSTMEMNPILDAEKDTIQELGSAYKARNRQESVSQLSSSHQSSSSRQNLNRSSHHQLRSLSSMSTQSEMGDRVTEARSDKLTRRASYCSAREDIEDERERLEPEGSFSNEATE
jgi:hypothetical protein